MKYFAHYAAASDDPKISKLVDREGYVGYAIFFMLCERLAGMKKGPTDTQSYLFQTKIWAKRGSNHTQTMTKVILNLAKLGLIEAQPDGVDFIIKIPKLNNYMDENTKRRERELKTPRRRGAGQTIPDVDHTRPEKDLNGKAASSASALGAEPTPQEVNVEEDPEARAQTLKNLRAMADQIFKTDRKAEVEELKAVLKASGSEEPNKPGQPQTVDPKLEQELVLTRADISDLGIEPARANQVTTLLAEFHSSRIDAFQLSYRLGGILTPAEKLEVLKINGVVARRRPE
jgi:hypothetical protein